MDITISDTQLAQARQSFVSAWKTQEALLGYYTKEIDPRIAFLRGLQKEATEIKNAGRAEEEALMMSMARGSNYKKNTKDGFGSNLSIVKSKPQQRQSAMNDSIWSGLTSLKQELNQPRLSYQSNLPLPPLHPPQTIM